MYTDMFKYKKNDVLILIKNFYPGKTTYSERESKQMDKYKCFWKRFQAKPFNITEIQVYAPNSNAEEAEVNGSMKIYKTF